MTSSARTQYAKSAPPPGALPLKSGWTAHVSVFTVNSALSLRSPSFTLCIVSEQCAAYVMSFGCTSVAVHPPINTVVGHPQGAVFSPPTIRKSVVLPGPCVASEAEAEAWNPARTENVSRLRRMIRIFSGGGEPRCVVMARTSTRVRRNRAVPRRVASRVVRCRSTSAAHRSDNTAV